MIRVIAANFEPARGYGHGMRRVLEAVQGGALPWDEAARSVWPGGSMGNGAAARVGPIACAFYADPALATIAADSARVGHEHPIGVAGAFAMAQAISAAIRGGDVFAALNVAALRDRIDAARSLDADDPR